MNLVKASFEFIEQEPGLKGCFKQIERAGRTCYKSEDKITDTSCEEFVSRMVNSGHGAMLEHGTVYLYRTFESKEECMLSDFTLNYHENPFSKVVRVRDDMANPKGKQHLYITTNYRVLVENEWLDDLQYQCEPTEYHEKRIAVRVICDRGVSHEFVRHRVKSFAQESTRYCNYIKAKFGGSVTCITPPWLQEHEELEFEEDLTVIEQIYFKWLKKGWTAQQARGFLSTFTKTELVMTGFVSDWEHFFELRCHSTAHPQAREIAIPLQEQFIEKGYING
jgi:thymidylate synthase (FAD)